MSDLQGNLKVENTVLLQLTEGTIAFILSEGQINIILTMSYLDGNFMDSSGIVWLCLRVPPPSSWVVEMIWSPSQRVTKPVPAEIFRSPRPEILSLMFHGIWACVQLKLQHPTLNTVPPPSAGSAHDGRVRARRAAETNCPGSVSDMQEMSGTWCLVRPLARRLVLRYRAGETRASSAQPRSLLLLHTQYTNTNNTTLYTNNLTSWCKSYSLTII